MSVRTNGTSSYLERTGNLPAIGLFTACIWVRVRLALANTWQPAISLGSTAGNPTCAIGNSNVSGTTNWGLYNRQDGIQVPFGSTPALGEILFLVLMCNGTNLIGRQRRQNASAFETLQTTPATGTPNTLRLGNSSFDGTDFATYDYQNFKLWDRVLSDAQLWTEMQSEAVVDARDLSMHVRLRNTGDLVDRGPRGRNFARISTLNDAGNIAMFKAPPKLARIRVDAGAAGGGATTRGMPFGNRGKAFNGGRIFVGPLTN